MRACISSGKSASGCLLVLSLAMVFTVNAGNRSAASMGQPQDATLLLAESSNPWALPPVQDDDAVKQPPSQSRDQPYYSEDDHYWHRRSNRFVTPETLESLKRQQTQSQLMYSNPYIYPPQAAPAMPQYGGAYYGMRPSVPAATYSGPLYDPYPVSPRGNTPGLLYQGQSFPLVPAEAMGGLPPIPLYDSYPGVRGDFFNPYAFSHGMFGY